MLAPLDRFRAQTARVLAKVHGWLSLYRQEQAQAQAPPQKQEQPRAHCWPVEHWQEDVWLWQHCSFEGMLSVYEYNCWCCPHALWPWRHLLWLCSLCHQAACRCLEVPLVQRTDWASAEDRHQYHFPELHQSDWISSGSAERQPSFQPSEL